MRNTAEPVRVLLIDDDDLSREILELMLDEAGWAVVAASSGEEVLALLGSGAAVEVMLVDMKMPGLAGADLATALRAACTRPPQALLAMSGSEPAGGATTGYDGFLLKPFTMEQFAEAVWRAKAGEANGSLSESRGGADVLTANVLDEVKLLRLQASFTPEQIDELFCFAMTDAERQLETMRLAEAEGDDALYRRCAHSMKGSFGMLGAPELRTLAATAEEAGLSGLTTEVTNAELFLSALSRLRHTLVSRGICHG